MDYTIIIERPLKLPQAPQTFNLVFAENGTLHEYPISKFISSLSEKESSALMDFIENEFNIPCDDQVILRAADGKQLEFSMNLREFLEKDQLLHVFDKRFYREEVTSDDFEVINSISPRKTEWSELKLDCLPELYETYLQAGIKCQLDPGLVDKGEEIMTIFCDVGNEINSLKEASIKLKRQKDSESVAKKNLMGYYVEKKKKFDEAFSHMRAKIMSFQVLFEGFESYLEKLSKMEIDPELGERGKKFLIDYLDVGKAKSNKIAYEKNQGKIMVKCDEIEKEIMEYDGHLKKMEEDIPDYYLQVIDCIKEQELKLRELHNKSLERLQLLLSRGQEPVFIDHLNNFVNQEWETTIPKLRKLFQELQEVRAELDGYLKDNAMKLKDFVSDVANIQLVIREKLQNRQTVFRSLVDKHEKDIFALKAIAEFPAVYQASVEEINRRYRSKEDCLTVLNILENFINSENNIRDDFMKKYSAYLPKSFCPMLSKSFPRINFEYLQKLINEDESFSLSRSFSSSTNMNENGRVIQLLKTLNATAETKECRIQELEDMLKAQAEYLNKFKGQLLRPKPITSSDLNEVLEKNGFQEKVKSMFNDMNEKCQNHLDILQQQLENLQLTKIEPFEAAMKRIREEIGADSSDANEKSIVELVKELKQGYEDKIRNQVRLLEEKRLEKARIIDHLEMMEEKMEKLAMESNQIKEEKDELKEVIKSLTETITAKEENESALKGMIANLKDNLESDQDAIVSLGRDLNGKEQEIEALSQEIENLRRMYDVASDILQEKQEAVYECKSQLENLWEALAEKENYICDVHHTLENLKKEMEYIQLQNEKYAELMITKDKLLEEMQGKIQHQQAKLLVLENVLDEKGEEVAAVEENLGLCQEALDRLRVQKDNLEIDLDMIQRENAHIRQEKLDLVSLLQTTKQNWHTSEETVKDLQISLRQKVMQIERLQDGKNNLVMEIEMLKNEKRLLGEQIREEVTEEFLHSLSMLEENLKAKDQEVELLREVALQNMPPDVERLANGDYEVPNKYASTEVQTEGQQIPAEKPVATNCDCLHSVLSGGLLGEFGEAILEVYASLMGKYGEELLMTKPIDLKDIMAEIPRVIKGSMVKIQDLIPGDKVLGIRIPGSEGLYQIIQREDNNYNVLYLYKPKEEYGEILAGVIEDLTYMEDNRENNELLSRLSYGMIINVGLTDVKTVGSVPRYAH